MKTRLIVREGKVIELKENEIEIPKGPQVFSIGNRSGFKWLKKSANKTWLEGNKIIKEKRGKNIPQ